MWVTGVQTCALPISFGPAQAGARPGARGGDAGERWPATTSIWRRSVACREGKNPCGGVALTVRVFGGGRKVALRRVRDRQRTTPADGRRHLARRRGCGGGGGKRECPGGAASHPERDGATGGGGGARTASNLSSASGDRSGGRRGRGRRFRLPRADSFGREAQHGEAEPPARSARPGVDGDDGESDGGERRLRAILGLGFPVREE